MAFYSSEIDETSIIMEHARTHCVFSCSHISGITCADAAKLRSYDLSL
jgi:hypothetical protein